MSNGKYCFQYCQKLVIFSEDWSSIFLARRHGEADFDGTYSFIGGKMDTSDTDILDGLRREKNEEVGQAFTLQVYIDATHNLFFRKKDGNTMILPHYIARHIGGEIHLNTEEYSEFRWIKHTELDAFEPKIGTIKEAVAWALKTRATLTMSDFTQI